MSSSVVLCRSLIFSNPRLCANNLFPPPSREFLVRGRRRFGGLIANAKKKKGKGYSRKRSWWQKFFFDDDGNWLGLRDDDMLDYEEGVGDEESGGTSGENSDLSESHKFEEWKKRAEAIVELREAQEDIKNEESRMWEDWLVFDEMNPGNGAAADSWNRDWDDGAGNNVVPDGNDMVPKKGFVESVRDMVIGREDDDMLYEDRVFQYASLNSAKFLAILIIVPWVLDFVVHDYVLVPFLDR